MLIIAPGLESEYGYSFSFMLFNEFLSEIETDNLTVSNSVIITLDFTVFKKKQFHEVVSFIF